MRACKALMMAATLLASTAVQARDLVIHAGRLIDGSSEAVREKVSILVHDERITAIAPGFVTPAGATVIDLADKTVLPGLIDTHDHITAGYHPGDPIRTAVTRTPFQDAIEATAFARATLRPGLPRCATVAARLRPWWR